MSFSIHHYLIMGSFAFLLGCAASETNTPQVEIKKSEPQTVSTGQKAYLDPETGELTSEPPAAEVQQRSETNTEVEPAAYDIVINEHGVATAVPRNPVRHELKARLDCDGNLSIYHGIDFSKRTRNCTQQDSTKEVK